MSTPISDERWLQITKHMHKPMSMQLNAPTFFELDLYREVERLRAELKEYLEMAFYSMAHLRKTDPYAGWWDTMALGDVRRMGDTLVEMGIFERHADGKFRRQWYRPLREAPLIEQSLKHVGTTESPTPLGDQTPFKEHLDASSATVAEWPGWKRDVLRKEPTDEKKIR